MDRTLCQSWAQQARGPAAPVLSFGALSCHVRILPSWQERVCRPLTAASRVLLSPDSFNPEERIQGRAVLMQQRIAGTLIKLGKRFGVFPLSIPPSPFPSNRPWKGLDTAWSKKAQTHSVYLESSCPGRPGFSHVEMPVGTRTRRRVPSQGWAGAERRPSRHRGQTVQSHTPPAPLCFPLSAAPRFLPSSTHPRRSLLEWL